MAGSPIKTRSLSRRQIRPVTRRIAQNQNLQSDTRDITGSSTVTHQTNTRYRRSIGLADGKELAANLIRQRDNAAPAKRRVTSAGPTSASISRKFAHSESARHAFPTGIEDTVQNDPPLTLSKPPESVNKTRYIRPHSAYCTRSREALADHVNVAQKPNEAAKRNDISKPSATLINRKCQSKNLVTQTNPNQQTIETEIENNDGLKTSRQHQMLAENDNNELASESQNSFPQHQGQIIRSGLYEVPRKSVRSSSAKLHTLSSKPTAKGTLVEDTNSWDVGKTVAYDITPKNIVPCLKDATSADGIANSEYHSSQKRRKVVTRNGNQRNMATVRPSLISKRLTKCNTDISFPNECDNTSKVGRKRFRCSKNGPERQTDQRNVRFSDTPIAASNKFQVNSCLQTNDAYNTVSRIPILPFNLSPKESIAAPLIDKPPGHIIDDPTSPVGESQVPTQQVLHNSSDQHARGVAGSINLSTDTYNSLKTDLAAAKRISMELLEKLTAAKETIRDLEGKNRKLMIQSQFSLASKAPLAHFSEFQFKAKAPKKSFKDRLAEELLQIDAPKLYQKFFFHFLENITTLAHEFSSEVCSSSRAGLSGTEWAPNDEVNKLQLVRDWRGRCVSYSEFQPFSIDINSDIRSLGSPLPHLYDGKMEQNIDVAGLYYPVCLMEEAQRGTLYTSSQISLKSFIAESVLLLVGQAGIECTSEMRTLTNQTCHESSVLCDAFDMACRKVMSARKRAIRDAYFGSLGYTKLCATSSRVTGTSFHQQQMVEEIMAKEKLVRRFSDNENHSGQRDLSFWRTADVFELCCKGYLSDASAKPIKSQIDKLFKNNPARQAYLVFRKYEVCETIETSVLSIARLDAIIASIVDGLADQCAQAAVSDCNEMEHFQGRIGNSENATPTTATKRNQAFRRRGGRKPLDSVQRFQSHLPMAVSQLMSYCCDEYRFECAERGLSQDELRIISRGPKSGVAGLRHKTTLDNHSRQHTLSFRYPANGHYYVSLTNQSFADFICDWIGVVNDCYILHANALEKPLLPFDHAQVQEFINESDEERFDESEGAEEHPEPCVTAGLPEYRCVFSDSEDEGEDL